MTRGEIALFVFIFLLVYMAEYVPKWGAKIGARFDRSLSPRGSTTGGENSDERR
jgi:hypothetical protein